MEAIILIIIVLICIYSIKSYMKKLQNGCCCGETESIKKVRVKDKNLSHYPYEIKIRVNGMTCSHCKIRVENALNILDGVFAKVNLDAGIVTVHMKNKISEDILKKAIIEAGYQVQNINFEH